ncbi:YfbU family protein [Enterobacter sp.]|uniref:YfbU family protein n=1 Tax=Enterobacter sp. TaxID=42895 RepID=UPI0029823E20|nr:YfbU family protein [Enterobacter sp.]
MDLRDSEKLILAMVCEIHTSLKLNEDGYDSNLISEALFSGNTWAIEWKYGDVLGFKSNETPHSVSEVCDILEMWEFLEEGFDELSVKDKRALELAANPFGREVYFRGFDGNNETEYMSIARFLIQKMDLFQHFAGRDLNSHMPSMASYLRMYAIFKPWRDDYPGRPLNLAELTEILQARILPKQ